MRACLLTWARAGGGGAGDGAGAISEFAYCAFGNTSVQISGTKIINPIAADSARHESVTVKLLLVLPAPSTNV